MTPSQEETYSEAETAERREATLKVMLATPHKPHKAKAMVRTGVKGDSTP